MSNTNNDNIWACKAQVLSMAIIFCFVNHLYAEWSNVNVTVSVQVLRIFISGIIAALVPISVERACIKLDNCGYRTPCAVHQGLEERVELSGYSVQHFLSSANTSRGTGAGLTFLTSTKNLLCRERSPVVRHVGVWARNPPPTRCPGSRKVTRSERSIVLPIVSC